MSYFNTKVLQQWLTSLLQQKELSNAEKVARICIAMNKLRTGGVRG